MYISSAESSEAIERLQAAHRSLAHDRLLSPARDSALGSLHRDLLRKTEGGQTLTVDDLAHAREVLAPTLYSATRALMRRSHQFEDTASEPHPAVKQGLATSARLADIEIAHDPHGPKPSPLLSVVVPESLDLELCPEHLQHAFASLPHKPFRSPQAQHAYLAEVHALIDSLQDRMLRIFQRDGKRKIAELRRGESWDGRPVTEEMISKQARKTSDHLIRMQASRSVSHQSIDLFARNLGLDVPEYEHILE